jgi:cell division protein FtsI (penicillin-binding protein 3)
MRLVLVLVFLLVAARIVDVQVLRSGQYRLLASQEQVQTVTIPALRGGIFDRNGAPLALSVPTKSVVADDFQIQHPATEAEALSPMVGIPVGRLTALLSERSGYVPIAQEVSVRRGDQVATAAFPGITLITGSKRVVPNGDLAGPVLGTTHASGTGASGIEYQYNGLTAGKAGSEKVATAPDGIALPGASVVAQSPARPGNGVELTLDEPLQYKTEQYLAAAIVSSHAVSGIAEVMDVKTGEILSMANLVANPGAGATRSTETPATPPVTAATADAKPIVIGPKGPVSEAPSNLAVTQLYEPGSVFKLVTFSAALEDEIIDPHTVFSVPDSIELDGSRFHDAETHPTETLTATQILAQSSNVGTSEIAQDLGETRLLAQVKNLGFGQRTDLGFPGEEAGLVAGAAQWEPTDYVSLPIGQVDAVTAQQVIDAYNAVANGGVFVQPRLLFGTVGASGAVIPAPASPTRRVFNPATDSELTDMLEQGVDVGTGTSAVVPGYTVAGKTGTAQIPTPGQDSYVTGAYMASFVGFAPANHPVLSAIIVLDRPTPIFGGTVSAPVFSQVMSYALHRYDIPTTPGAPTQGQPQTTTPDSSQTQDIT